jgi:hypothetical protein
LAGQPAAFVVSGNKAGSTLKGRTMIRIRPTKRIIRNGLLSAAVAGAGLAGLVGTAAAHASVSGIVTVKSCGALAGKATYSPGLLTSTAQNTTATLTGFVSNCGSTGSGFGKVDFQLSGAASLNAENFGSGTFTINWPGSTEPSEGTAGVIDASGTEELSGTITSGPLTGGVIAVDYLPTGQTGKGTAAKPVTAQSYINSTSITVMENGG